MNGEVQCLVNNLGDDVLHMIAATLPPVAIARLAASCRRMRMGSNQMWKAVCERFGFGFFREGHFRQFGATKARERKWIKVLLDYLCTECNQPSRFYIKVDLNGGQSTGVSDTRCLCSACLAAVPRDKKLALPHTSLRHGTLVRNKIMYALGGPLKFSKHTKK